MEEKDEERFWSKVEKTEGCWNWIGSKRNGYGRFKLDGNTWRAHRLLWTHCFGIIDDGIDVRHKCTGKCVNPDHLELGTSQDNHDDMKRDGTVLKGEKHPNAKFTRQQIDEIRASTVDTRELARIYGVYRSTIYKIQSGDSWKD